MASVRTSNQLFFGVNALIFAASVAVTIVWCTGMQAMQGMSMPGDWTMSMAWMRMPEQTWMNAAVSFLGMWVAMMLAMMIPTLVPMLLRYRRAVGNTTNMHLNGLTAVAGTGYFFVWTILGFAAFLIGVGLAAIAMREPVLARAVPVAISVAVLLAGLLQFTPWKSHNLVCCRELPVRGSVLPADLRTAWRHGLLLGRHCSKCCAGLMVVLLVIGVMDLRVMVIVAAAITIERLAPDRRFAARTIGVVTMGAGLFLLAQATGIV